jgi:outer membrane protein assembly factor BamB
VVAVTPVRDRKLRSAASPPASSSQGVAYVTTDGALVVRNPRTGRRRWELRLGPARSPGRGLPPPVISGGVVCVRAGRDLLGVELDSGRELWRSSPDAAIRSAPAVADGMVLAGDAAGRCCAFGAARGGLHWSAELGGDQLDGAPVCAGGIAYVPTSRGTIHALGLHDGNELWPAVAGIRPPYLAINEDTLLAGCGDRLLALNPHSGERRWRRRADGATGTGLAAAQDAVVSCGETSVCCAAIEDGELRWTHSLRGRPGAPVIAGDVVLVVGPATLHGVSLSEGAELWNAALDARPVGAPVVTDDGYALLMLANGTVDVWLLP